MTECELRHRRGLVCQATSRNSGQSQILIYYIKINLNSNRHQDQTFVRKEFLTHSNYFTEKRRIVNYMLFSNIRN